MAMNPHPAIVLVHNQRSDSHETTDHEAAIRETLENADEIYIAVAFMKHKALQSILSVLKPALERGATAKIIVVTNFYVTEPDALAALHKACGDHRQLHAYLFPSGRGRPTFHPKLYCAVHGQEVTILIGSANLTGGGLRDNFELSLRYSMDSRSPIFQALTAWLNETIAREGDIDLDGFKIASYRAEYDVHLRHKRDAERKARDEIKRQRTFDPKLLLKQYFKQYNADKGQRDDWNKKQSKYRDAKKLLDGMINTPPATREAFLATYERLVGPQSGHLWHSGDIGRRKADVADGYTKFLEMLREVRDAIGRPASEVFGRGLNYVEQIPYLGRNVLTEIMNTYDPQLYSVLNRKPIKSLRIMKLSKFPDPGSFGGDRYDDYNNQMKEIRKACRFKDLSQVDHFMNYVSDNEVKGAPSSAS